MKKSFRFLLLITILLLVFSFAYSSAESAHHDCSGEDCPICAILFIVTSLFLLPILLVSAANAFFKERKVSEKVSKRVFSLSTPVSLKTKLSD